MRHIYLKKETRKCDLFINQLFHSKKVFVCYIILPESVYAIYNTRHVLLVIDVSSFWEKYLKIIIT